MPALPRTATTFAPPVMEARRWLEGAAFPPDRPLINVSQAAPVEPPPEGLRQAVSAACLTDDSAHLYGPVLGRDDLREELAGRMSGAYLGRISADQVAITAGCNQAFCAAITALCGEADEVILPVPWYFNHKMWLDMAGVGAVPLPTGDDLLPDPEAAAARITGRSRAIVLVTPNNPGGVEYPADLLRAFYRLAQSRGLKLIIDETYRDFHSGSGAPHDLFTDPDWAETLVHLYSFSKAYRLTGHRVGAIVANPALLAQVEKFLDAVAICPNQLGQIGALWGMRNLDGWLAGERAEILARRAAIHENLDCLSDRGWQLLGCGAYFAYLRHPFARPSDTLAPLLVREAGILLLPGTMFRPAQDKEGRQEVRVAFANIDRAGIGQLFERLAGLAWPLAPAARGA